MDWSAAPEHSLNKEEAVGYTWVGVRQIPNAHSSLKTKSVLKIW